MTTHNEKKSYKAKILKQLCTHIKLFLGLKSCSVFINGHKNFRTVLYMSHAMRKRVYAMCK